MFWNQPKKTIRIGASDEDAEYDDLGAWARCKRMMTRRWTFQIREGNKFSANVSAGSLEDAAGDSELLESAIGQATDILTLPVMQHVEDLPGGMQKVGLHPGLRTPQRAIESRRDSAGRPSSQGSSAGPNSGIMVEEEKPTWLQDLSEGKGRHLADWLGTTRVVSKPDTSESRRPSHISFSPSSDDSHEGVRHEDTH